MSRVLLGLSFLSLIVLAVATALMIAAIDRPPSSPPARATPPAGIEVAVRDEAGAAIPSIEVMILEGDEVLVRGETDFAGEVSFPEILGRGSLVVLAPGRTPYVREIALVASRTEVVLLRGRSVSGVVTVDGEAPAEPLRLVLDAPGDPRVETDGAGRFRFWGLPSDWRGALVLPAGFAFAEVGGDARRLDLDGPADGLEIAVRRIGADPAPPRSARLRVRVRNEDGMIPVRVLVRLESEGSIFSEREAPPDPLVGGTRVGGGRVEPDGAFEEYRPSPDGIVVAGGVRPGAPLLIEAVEESSGSVLEAWRIPLEAGEEREIGLVVGRADGVLAGRVVAADGGPVPGSRVSLSGDGRRHRSTFSGEDGSFRFGDLRGRRFRVRAEKPGFVSDVVFERAPGEEVVLTLIPGCEVRVTVADEAGAPIAAVVGAEVPGLPVFLDGESRWPIQLAGEVPAVFSELPPGHVVLRATLAGRDYEITHDARDPEARIVVPVHGSVRVRWRLPVAGPERHLLRLVPTGAAGAAVVQEFPGSTESGDREVVFSAVLPGAYRVHLDRPAARTGAWEEWIAGPEITVKPGRRAEATIGR